MADRPDNNTRKGKFTTAHNNEQDEVKSFSNLANRYGIQGKTTLSPDHKISKTNSEHLMIAVTSRGFFKIEDIERLVKNGADPDYQNSRGASPRKIVNGMLSSNNKSDVIFSKKIKELFDAHQPEVKVDKKTKPKKR